MIIHNNPGHKEFPYYLAFNIECDNATSSDFSLAAQNFMEDNFLSWDATGGIEGMPFIFSFQHYDDAETFVAWVAEFIDKKTCYIDDAK